MFHLERKNLKNIDLYLLGSAIVLAVLGCVVVRSATHDDPDLVRCAGRQILWVVLGLICLVLALVTDWQNFERWSSWIYGINMMLLTTVFIPGIGARAGGAQRWINLGSLQLQPSELAKVAVIICLAVWLLEHHEEIEDFSTVLRSLLYIAPPMLFVLAQPDLGTALVFFALWLGMVHVAGARLTHTLSILAGCLIIFALAWSTGLVKEYQKERLTAFVNPNLSPLDAGYHVIQSQIAIGSGKMWGKGLFHGTQNKLNFIPEQHTDFIFTIVGEELGFIGAVIVLGLYFVLLWRGIAIAGENENLLGTLLAAGIVSLFLFQILVNIGMTMRIMPIAGVPLPFLSYGGSSMISNMLLVGLLLGIGIRRQKLTF